MEKLNSYFHSWENFYGKRRICFVMKHDILIMVFF